MGGINILLVEKSVAFARAIRGFVSPWPHARIVGHARTAIEALQSLDRLQIDLVLVDATMLATSDIDLAAHIKALRRKPKVIVMTLLSLQDGEQIAPGGADGLVGKDKLASQLLPLVDLLCGQAA